VGGNCLAAALMLFQEAHPSSKLGDVPLKTSCIIFLMMSPPKQSQKIIQSYRIPWRNSRSHAISRGSSLKQAWGCSSQNTMHHLFDDVTSQTISKNYSKLPSTLEELSLAMEEQPPTLKLLST